MKPNRRKSPFEYRSLEPRQLLAGDVTVFENGELYIRGDELSNQIQIIANDDGEIYINGLHGTTINGSSDSFEVQGATDLNGLHNRNASFAGGLRIKMFGGHDRIDVRDVKLEGSSFISTGDGNDFVRFHTSTSKNDLTMISGDGDDTLRFFQARGMGDLTAMTGDGQDNVTFWNSRVWKDTTLVTGADNDSVTAAYARFTGDSQQIFTQGGDDRVELVRNNVGSAGLTVATGAEHDRVIAEMAESNEVLGMIEIDGQIGMDVLDMVGVNGNADMLAANGFENNGGEVVFSNSGEVVGSRMLATVGQDNETNRAAVRVQYDDATMITSVSWAGSYDLNHISSKDSFVIEIYEDSVSEPLYDGDEDLYSPTGDAIASFTVGDGVGADIERTDTGETVQDSGDRYLFKNVFKFDTEIAYQMEAGKAYWVSIQPLALEKAAGSPFQPFFEMGLVDSEAAVQTAFFTGGRPIFEPGPFETFWNASNSKMTWSMSLRS